MNLDIHLDSSDTLMSTSYFKVHITKEVFQSLDICQYNVIIVCIPGNQTTGNTCYGALNRYASCHQ